MPARPEQSAPAPHGRPETPATPSPPRSDEQNDHVNLSKPTSPVYAFSNGVLQAQDLDRGLELGNRSVDILAQVQSSRAEDYVSEFNAALAPWRREPAVREFIHRNRKELGVAA
ncbi:hypothetical protein [Streptomyces sp. NBC_00316]|uniref:hypothetical protein n=1 Tax=Streptomyces sp. NBC_00316 TaxID=2975710 RepID=UPI002E2AC3AF|nr:hypothetical protein [Streptomyces sp. NBC_00316]